VKKKTEDIRGNLQKKRIRALKNLWTWVFGQIKTNFGAVDNESTGLFAVHQDMSLPDLVSAWSVSMRECLYTFEWS